MGSKPTSPNLPSQNVRRRAAARTLALGVVATLLGGALVAPASAQTQAMTQTAPAPRAVSYADLDLARPADARALMGRLQAAAAEACGDHPDYSPLFPRARHDFLACTQDAVAAAVARIDHPALTALAPPDLSQSPVGALASR